MLLSVANDGHLFSWNIYQRKTQLGVRLTEGGFTSFHAAHEAGSKALAEEWHDELRPTGGTRGALGMLANHVGGSFPDHDRRRIGITPYHRGHDRGIRYSQAVDALDPETGIDHRHRIALWAHLAGSDRVVLSISTVTNIPFYTGGIVDPRWVQHLAAH